MYKRVVILVFIVCLLPLLMAANTSKINIPGIGEVELPDDIPADLPKFIVSGKVKLLDLAGSENFIPGDGVRVTVKVDLNNDGSYVDLVEKRETTTNGSGEFSVTAVPYLVAKTFIVEFEKSGYTRTIKTVEGYTLADITVDATMYKMKEVACADGNCSVPGGTVQLIGVGGKSGYVQAFDPTAQTDAFPGSFDDVQGNLLVSQSFANIDLKSDGELSENAVIRMLVPQSTWSTLKDYVPNNGQIDIALFYFDETSGEWKQHQNYGWLEAGDYQKIAESNLGAIKNGTYGGIVFAVGLIDHLSWWNVDNPVDTHACIKIRVFDSNGAPVGGVKIETEGITYDGASQPKTTDGNGDVRIAVMRSEEAGEDIDGNGSSGDQSQVIFTGYYHDVLFQSGAVSVLAKQGNCASGDVSQSYDFGLNDGTQVNPDQLCTIYGELRFSGVSMAIGGAATETTLPKDSPLPEKTVVVVSGNNEVMNYLCNAQMAEKCALSVETDSNGKFQVTLPIYKENSYSLSFGGGMLAPFLSDGGGQYVGDYNIGFSCPNTSPANPLVVSIPHIRSAIDLSSPSDARLVLNQMTDTTWNVTLGAEDSNGVSGYLLVDSATGLSAYSNGWVDVAKTTEFSVTTDWTAPPSGRLYGFVKDGSGNMSAAVWVDPANRDSSANPAISSKGGCSLIRN